MAWKNKQQQQIWKLKNKDKIKAYSKRNYNSKYKSTYYQRNKERIKLWNRKYWHENKDRWKDSSRENWLKRNYGINLEIYNELFEKQNGCCAICEIHQSEQKRVMAVDHCHLSQKVRGLLCFRCNTALGKFGDNADLLNKAIIYLNKNE